MLTGSDRHHQTSFFGEDLLTQLDPSDPLLLLAREIPWREFDKAFEGLYCDSNGRPSIPIRVMVGLLILKQLEDLSDENVVLQWKRNPYYQAFCGLTNFQNKTPCHATELVHLRNRIGESGTEKIFQMSVQLHGQAKEEHTPLTSTPPCRKRTSPTRRMASWRSKSSIG